LIGRLFPDAKANWQSQRTEAAAYLSSKDMTYHLGETSVMYLPSNVRSKPELQKHIEAQSTLHGRHLKTLILTKKKKK
jgi:hypothetical protein